MMPNIPNKIEWAENDNSDDKVWLKGQNGRVLNEYRILVIFMWEMSTCVFPKHVSTQENHKRVGGGGCYENSGVPN